MNCTFNSTFLGIDIAKSTFDAALLGLDDKLRQRKFSNDLAGLSIALVHPAIW